MSPDEAYWAARRGAVVIDRSHEGRVWLSGRDRLGLLQRMSTNELEGLAEGEARPTVLTTPVARMVDLLWVLNLGDRALMLTSPGQSEAVRRWLSGYIFFNDDVRLQDANKEMGQLGVYGPGAARGVAALAPEAESLPEGRSLRRDALIILRGRPLAGDGFTLLGPAEELAQASEMVVSGGAVRAGEETYQVLRIEAGLPYIGHEISEEYIPLEAGLWSAVSFSKGCYIGQEIIARMESRGKLAKTLVGLKLDAPVTPGAEVFKGELRVGRVSSAAVSPGAGPIALAFVKPQFAEPGTRLKVDGAEAEIVPFPIGQA